MTTGRTLILIRHASPVIEPDDPPATWKLSERGVQESSDLASKLAEFGLRELVCSEEPKAVGTGREIAGRIGISWRTAPGLHEHERDAMDWYGADAWHARIRRLLEEPDELTMGRETARQAATRFSSAVDEVLRSSDAPVVGIVSHGTVISLYAAELTSETPYSIWKRLDMPDYVVLELDR